MSRSFEPGEYDEPGGYNDPGGYGGPAGPGGPRNRSGAVTAVGIIDIIWGALQIFCGIAGLAGAALLQGVASGAIQSPGIDPKIKEQATEASAMMTPLVTVVLVVMLISGVLMIVAGIGVLKRKNWGRLLTLGLGVLAAFLGVMALIPPGVDFVSAAINGLFCAFVLITLLSKKNAAEFA